ncbi:ABC transporter permease [Dysgonomonas mossii]|uniref:ABC transporter permease n=1 Tax=Dysgonomonas mossii TaxID=163665 RepID=A0A4Y9IRJ5_9BACT|nr:ABC transporter permease [Dysgonomonas mossii]MBF0760262.1 ABC transporter permease [Dysgonomonas mossii]TFU91207.1 ABC transporter permease [Dysgonomonas mossii]
MRTAKINKAFFLVLKRELARITSRRLYFGVCIILPLFCIFFMNTIFGSGGMENIPIGIVDMDQTSTSRQISRTLSTIPTAKTIKYYSDPKEAREATVKKEIYAYVVIPKNLESDLLGKRDATIPYYIHYALLSVGVEMEAALETVLAEVSLAPMVGAGTAAGTDQDRIESVILPVSFEAHPLFNPSLDYSIYLTNPFFFVLLQIIIILVTMYVLGSEIKFKTADEWLKTADMNIFIAVTGKLLPYTIMYIIMAILGNFVMFNISNIPLSASFLFVNLVTALFIIATQAFGVFIFSLFPALSIIISVASMVGSLGATLSGVTFPVFAMPPAVYYSSFLFPIRHFIEINQNILYGNYGFAYSWQHIGILLIYVLLALLTLPRFKNATLSHKYQDIE